MLNFPAYILKANIETCLASNGFLIGNTNSWKNSVAVILCAPNFLPNSIKGYHLTVA